MEIERLARLANLLGSLGLRSRKLRDVPFYFMKGHYFFMNAALAGVIPYLHVYAKVHGISPVRVGAVFCTLPFLTMVCKPLVGWVVDRKKQLKCIMVTLLTLMMLGCILLIFGSRGYHDLNGYLSCSAEGSQFYYLTEPKARCLSHVPENRTLLCTVSCKECALHSHERVLHHNFSKVDCDSGPQLDGRMEVTYQNNSTLDSFTVTSVSFERSLSMNTVCLGKLDFLCQTVCSRVMHKCFLSDESYSGTDAQFVILFVSAILVQTTFSIATSLSDVACFNLLGEQVHLYGRQRLWGTVGWALAAPLAAALNYALTQKDGNLYALYEGPVFNFGFSLAVFFLVFDVSFVWSLTVANLMFSKSILRDVFMLLKKPEVFMFLISVFSIGVLTGIFWTFLFWHLQTLGAPMILLGLATTVQCLVGELPFFFFAGAIIQKIGHFNTLTVNLLAFGIRFIAYSFLKNPWWVLPIEIFQGPTYGLFYTAMATYASVAALPGTEATMQGLVGGTFEGLGVAVGSLSGGYIMQNLGGKMLFRGSGLAAFACSIINVTFTAYVKFCSRKVPAQSQAVKEPPVLSPSEVTSFI